MTNPYSHVPQASEPPPLDYRADLGPLGDSVPPRLCAAPALLPVPLDMVPDEDWHPPQLVVIGAASEAGWAWRHDCWAVTRRRNPDAEDIGRWEVGVSVDAELAIGGTDAGLERIPRFWWLPSSQVWLERPSDTDDLGNRRVVAQEVPATPPVRQLTRAHDADRVIGRHGWLAHETGWHLIVAVSDLYEAEVADRIKVATGRRPTDSLRDTYVNLVRRRTWWRWGATGDWPDRAVFVAEADGVWLE